MLYELLSFSTSLPPPPAPARRRPPRIAPGRRRGWVPWPPGREAREKVGKPRGKWWKNGGKNMEHREQMERNHGKIVETYGKNGGDKMIWPQLTARIRLRLVMFECKPSHLVFQCFSSCLVSRSHRLQNVSMLTKKNFEWRRAPGTPSTPHLTFEYPQNRDWRWLKPWFKPKKTTNLRTEPRF